jgi:hypothetical protein
VFERFIEEARMVVVNAQEEARHQLMHAGIGTGACRVLNGLRGDVRSRAG